MPVPGPLSTRSRPSELSLTAQGSLRFLVHKMGDGCFPGLQGRAGPLQDHHTEGPRACPLHGLYAGLREGHAGTDGLVIVHGGCGKLTDLGSSQATAPPCDMGRGTQACCSSQGFWYG